MTDQHLLNTPHRRALWGPALVVVLSAIVLFALWRTLDRSETAHLQTSTEVTAEQIELRLESWVHTRLQLVEFLGRTWAAHETMNPNRFRGLARQYIEAAPGFQAINWIDSDWVVRIIVPESGNAPVLGFDLHEHPSPGVSHAISNAERTRRIHRSTLINLVQGGIGFATYYPVYGADDVLLGFVNGVFRNDTLVDTCLSEENFRSQFRLVLIEEDGQVAYSHGSSEKFEDWPFVVKRQVDVPDHPWTLLVAPSEEVLLSAKTAADEVLLAIGMILAILVAWNMHTSMKHHDALRMSESRYRLLVENQTDLIVKVDLEGCFEFVSPSYCNTFGKTEDEVLGYRFLPMIHEADRDRTARAMVELLSPPHSIYVEMRVMTKDGWRWFGWANTAVLDHNSEVTQIIGVGRDITKLKRLEEKLLQSQKMEAIGQLAGGVAHDFNNILQVMRGHLDLAEREITPEHDSAIHLAEVRQSAERAADLTRQLLAFGRRQVMQPELLDLRELAKTTVTMLERVIGGGITLNLEVGVQPRIVRADARQIEQVLINLCVNARDSMPNGGRATITVSSKLLDETFCQENPWAQLGTFATVEVHDTGIGMDAATRAQIFEPFFTTKPIGEGSGLGLATVFGIIKQHEGFIDVVSEPGEGSRFTVFLPLIDGSRPREARAEALEAPGGTETVLLAEDDPSVRAVVQQILEESGYRVVPVPDGSSAITLIDEDAEEIDLAVLDVVMPGVGGLEVADHIKNSGKAIKLLLTSGYSLELARTMVGEDLSLLTKPFRREELLQRVRELLDT